VVVAARKPAKTTSRESIENTACTEPTPIIYPPCWIIKCYNKTGKSEKAGFYNNYVKKVISRVWGKDNIGLLNSLSL
jgi:hypothetical protein